MNPIRVPALLLPLLLAAAAARSAPVEPGEIEAKLKSIRLPSGFSIALFANDLNNARSLAEGAKGTVFVSTRNDKHVYAVADRDGDGRAEESRIVFTLGEPVEGKEQTLPNGIAFREGALYVATSGTIFRLDGIEERLDSPPAPAVVSNLLPAGKTHGWRYIGFGPDSRLYVAAGAPCNNCVPEDPLLGTILRLKADGSAFETVARGVRNSLGFDWHPETGRLWFTDNGADKLGDGVPGDELNVVMTEGAHFGFPYIHEGDMPDPEFGKDKKPGDYEPPAVKLAAHTAALGMRFVSGPMFPAEYRNRILIAEHGSGGVKPPVGYRVMMVRTRGDKASDYEVFAEGWLEGENAWGRPVDVCFVKDGSLLVSDDRAGALYRIVYKK